MKKTLQYQLYARPVFKVLLALSVAFYYFIFCFNYASLWIQDVAEVYNYYVAVLFIAGIALIPGFINAFVLMCMLLDKRPNHEYVDITVPPVTILIAAYNEEKNIQNTLTSVVQQQYANKIQCIVIDDGSTDATNLKIQEFLDHQPIPVNITIFPITMSKNSGKANALNMGLKCAEYKDIITLDGDSWLHTNAITILVTDLYNSPGNTVACAGTILVKNSRTNWITKFQEQDYFYSISAIKRTQHLARGVLVAQGALSIYKKWAIEECGGWRPLVGEDIILSWDILNRGYFISHSDKAICWTNAPDTYKQYFQQRRRWARGMIEAFKQMPEILFTLQPYTVFIWFNTLFPLLDFSYIFVFTPAVLAALFFGYYLLVSKMTLLLIPMGILINIVILNAHLKTFKYHNLRVRKHYFWMLFYFLFGNLLSSPAALRGYIDEAIHAKKSWGTK
jgi:biofilm PGA synthesis N-glycosyltransferase PgaC